MPQRSSTKLNSPNFSGTVTVLFSTILNRFLDAVAALRPLSSFFPLLKEICEVCDDSLWTVCYQYLNRDLTRGTEWCQSFLEHGLVDKAARALEAIFRLHQEAAALGDLPATDAQSLAFAASQTATVVACAWRAASSPQVAEGESCSCQASSSPVAELFGQLTADSTWQALTGAVVYVRQQLWPAAAAECAIAVPPANSASVPALEGVAGVAGAENARVALDCGSSGAQLVQAISSCLLDALQDAAAGNGCTIPARKLASQRLLASIHSSGVLEGLCSAILEAPPYPPTLPNAATIDSYSKYLSVAIYDLCNTMTYLAYQDWPDNDMSRIVQLLSAPPVQQLRWALLRQVAETAPGGSGELQLPIHQLQGGSGGQEGGGCSGGGAAASGDGAGASCCWPFFQRQPLRLVFGPKVQLTCALIMALQAAGTYRSPADLAACGRHSASQAPPLPEAISLVSRAVRALCARAEYLGESGAMELSRTQAAERALGNEYIMRNVPALPRDLLTCGLNVRCIAPALMRDATPATAAACAPDVLAMHAWLLRLAVTPAGLASTHYNKERQTLEGMGAAVRGEPASGSDPSYAGKRMEAWMHLDAPGRAACIRRLRPTRLMRSLDHLLRTLLARGCDIEAVGRACSVAYELLPPLLRAKLLGAWQARRAAPVPPGGTAGAGSVGGDTGSSGGDGGGASGGDGGCTELQGELGILLTLAKFLRGEQLAGCPNMSQAPPFSGAASGAGAADLALLRRLVAEVAALVTRSALPLVARLLEQSAEALQRGAEEAPSSVAGCALLGSEALLQALLTVPPAVLEPAQPQAVAVGVGRLASLAKRLASQAERLVGTGGNRSTFVGTDPSLQTVRNNLGMAIVLMASERTLQAGCPGWVWVKQSQVGQVQMLYDMVDVEALAAAAANPDLRPPRPVLCIPTVSSPLFKRRWEKDADLRRTEVIETAQKISGQALPTQPLWRAWPEEMVRGGGASLWPPRRLRLCGNPGCCNFSGAAEAELGPRQCGGCRAVRYCGEDCQRDHWRGGHREECAGLRARRGGGSG